LNDTLFDILDRLNIHIGAIEYIEEHSDQSLSHLLTSLVESMEKTTNMIQAKLTEQKPSVRDMIRAAS
jgi:hypothetical protein